jgi:hypothetical protein
MDIPIRYRERTYGSTNINRWSHGLLLMRMVLFSLFRIKMIDVRLQLPVAEMYETGRNTR